MFQRLIVYGLLVIALIFTAETQRTQREEIEIVVVQPQITRIRNPYQTEYEKMLYPTVRITTPSGTGSGVIIHRPAKDGINSDAEVADPPDGRAGNTIYILTACHVVDNQSVVDIELYNSTVITASVVITDTAKDLAILTIHNSSFIIHNYTARLAPKDYTPYIFTPVYSVGCSLGYPPRPSQGIISVVDKDHWEVTSPILPGNSGGPVYDARTYEVIGIAVWVKVYNWQLVTTMAGVVPIQEIHEFLTAKTQSSQRR